MTNVLKSVWQRIKLKVFRFTFLFSHYFDCSVMNSLYRCLSIVLDFDDVVNKFIFRIKFYVNASAQARNAIRSMRETKDENMRGGPFALWPFFRSVKHFVLLFARDNCVWIPIISCVYLQFTAYAIHTFPCSNWKVLTTFEQILLCVSRRQDLELVVVNNFCLAVASASYQWVN